MIVNRCDNCKKIIKDHRRDYLEIRMNYQLLEICRGCAEPIVQALEKNKLLPEKLLKNLQLTNP